MLMLAAGCVNVEYLGDSYAPTSNVEFYYDSKDVPPNTYKVMGKAVVNDGGNPFGDDDQIRQEIFKKARAVGADAVLIEKIVTRAASSNTNGYGQFNKVDRDTVEGFGNSTTNYNYEKEIHASFLKRIPPAPKEK